jgi:hypothetical protein
MAEDEVASRRSDVFIGMKEAAEIRCLIRWLKPGNPVRLAAERALRGQPAAGEALSEALFALMRPCATSWRERAVAAWLLGVLPVPARRREAVLSSLGLIVVQDPDIRPSLDCLALWMIVMPLWTFALLFSQCIKYRSFCLSDPLPYESVFWLGCLLSISLFAIACPAVSLLQHRGLNYASALAARSLGRLHSPDSIRPLALALASGARHARTTGRIRLIEAVQEALPQVLAELTTRHYGRIGRASLRSMGRALEQASEPVALAILDGLEMVGTGEMVGAVARAARWGHRERVRRTASEVLHVLQARLEAEVMPTRLLRAAGAPPNRESLLLPASFAQGAPRESLLRLPTNSRDAA